jgi:polysaccharide pyruvyl transferase WcaK-like protein
VLKSITLLGSSSGRNAGDAALMSGIMDPVDEACGERLLYEIPTINKAFVQKTYRNRTRPVGMMPWNLSLKMFGLPTYRSILRTDYTLIFDAILFDRALYNPLFNFLSTLAVLLPRAHRKGKRMACFNVGAGPVDSAAGRRMLREVAELMDFITVRDAESMDILRDVGVQNPNIVLAADAAVNVRPAETNRAIEILRASGLDPAQPILAVNVNRYLDTWARPRREPIGKEQFLDTFSKALNSVAGETGAQVLLIATQHHDVPITRELLGCIDGDVGKAWIGNVDYDHYELKGVMGQCSLLFAMRLHASILGASAGAPVLGLAYQPKVEYFYNCLGLRERCIGFDRFAPEDLTRHVLAGWRDRDRIKDVLRSRIPELQADARTAADVLAAVHRGESIEDALPGNSNRTGHS